MLSKTSKDLIGIIIIVLFIIIGISLFYYFQTHKTDDINETSGCEQSGPTGYYVIVVDNTNKLSFIQQEDIKNRIWNIIDNALPNDKIVVYSLGNMSKDNSNVEKINPLVEKCPSRDGSKANKWIANPEKLKKQKKERFDKPIKRALEGIIKREQDSKFSPIIELLQKIKVTVLHKVTAENKKKYASDKTSIEIHLFSDLLQHSPNYSFYRNDDLTQFLKSKKFNKVSSNLEEIKIIIWQLVNSNFKAKGSKILFDFERILRKMKVGGLERRNIEG